MRIPSGVTDQYIYFVAVDSTDLKTRETGLSSFTVYRSRNGAAAAAMTTPTVNETDTTNMPGVYELLLDEDMTIAAGNDSEEIAYHITQASMAPVTRTIELYRPKITAGTALAVTSGACDTVTTLTGHTAQTGDTYALANGSAGFVAIDTVVDSILVDTAEIGAAGAGLTDLGGMSTAMKAEVNAECDTAISDAGLTAAGIADAVWDEVLTGATHNVTNSAGKRLRDVAGAIFAEGTAQSGGNNSIQLASGDVTDDDLFNRAKVIIVGGTGINQEGIITDSVASTDTLTVTPAWTTNPDVTSEYVIMPAQVHATVRNGGYDNSAVYIDTVNGTAGTVKGVNGTSTNPSSVIADAYTIGAQEGVTKFIVHPGSALTLPAASDGRQFIGDQYTIALNSADIDNSSFEGASSVTGIATTGSANPPTFILCAIGTCTLPPANGFQCGFFGTITIGTEGNYTWGGSSEVFNNSLTIDYGSARNASQFYLTSWGGGNVEIQNAGAGTGSYIFSMNGIGDLTVNANCSATTTVTLRGNISRNTDVTGVTYVETANVNAANINTECDTAISDAALATAANLATAQNDLDIITGATGVNLLTATQASIDAIEADTNELQTDDIPTLIAALNDITTAQVNAEMVDVLFTDTQAELSAVPAANAPVADKIAWLFLVARNKLTQTATTGTVFADDGSTSIATSTVSDDATTATRGEFS